VGGIGVDVGKGVGVCVGGNVGVGESTAGRNGVGVEVLSGFSVMVTPCAAGNVGTGAAQPLTSNRINRDIKFRLPCENFMVEILI